MFETVLSETVFGPFPNMSGNCFGLSPGTFSETSTLWTDSGVDQNLQRDLGAVGPHELQGKAVWTNSFVPCFQGKSVWTNGPESSLKVSPETGIGPCMAHPSFWRRFRDCLRHCRPGGPERPLRGEVVPNMHKKVFQSSCDWASLVWKRLKGKNPEGKNFRELLRRKQSSAKISKISRNTLKSSEGDLFYLLRNLLKYLLRTFFLPRSFWEKLNRGVSKPGCFPLFSGMVQIVSRTLSGLFLVGADNRLRKRKRTNRENPRRVPGQIGKIPGKVPEGQKRTKKDKKDKKGRTSPDRETPPFETPPFGGPRSFQKFLPFAFLPSGSFLLVSKQGVRTCARRPGWQYDVTAASADSVLASDCRTQSGHPSTSRVCRIYIYICMYMYMYVYIPHTSIGGQIWGFEIYRSRGKKEK